MSAVATAGETHSDLNLIHHAIIPQDPRNTGKGNEMLQIMRLFILDSCLTTPPASKEYITYEQKY